MQVEICVESTAFRPRIHEGDKDTTSADGSGNEEVGELRSPTADLVLAANEMREVSSALRESLSNAHGQSSTLCSAEQ